MLMSESLFDRPHHLPIPADRAAAQMGYDTVENLFFVCKPCMKLTVSTFAKFRLENILLVLVLHGEIGR